jgi:hypothetical protein
MHTNKTHRLTPLAAVIFCGLQVGASLAQQAGGAIPTGAPVAPTVQASGGPWGPYLKYRNSSTPLTIGEMSDMQQVKAQAEFLRGHGFTTDVQPKPVATAPTVAQNTAPKKSAEKAAPSITVYTLAVWGKPSGLQAEAMVDGMLRNIKGGDELASGVIVQSVNSRGLTLTVKSKASKATKAARHAPAQPMVKVVAAPVGQTTRVSL